MKNSCENDQIGQNGRKWDFLGFLAKISEVFQICSKQIFARSSVIPGASFDVYNTTLFEQIFFAFFLNVDTKNGLNLC